MKKVSLIFGSMLLSALFSSCSSNINESAFVSLKRKTSGHFYLKSADFIHSLSFRSDGKVKVNETEKVSRLVGYSYDNSNHVVTLKDENLSLFHDPKTRNLYCQIAQGKPGSLEDNIFKMTVESDGDIESLEFTGRKTLKISTKYSEPDKVTYNFKPKQNLVSFNWNGNAYEVLHNQSTGELYTEVVHGVKNQAGRTKKVFSKKSKTTPHGFVRVQGGFFMMGSENGEAVEKPVHQVSLNSFYMSKTEITQQQYFDVMNRKPAKFASENTGSRPVECVSWYDAIYFCNLLSVSEGRTPCYSVEGISYPDFWNYEPGKCQKINGKIVCDYSTDGYRLPTEAEWEFAARGGNVATEQTVFAGADDVSAVAWYEGNSRNTTHDVASLNPNELVLFDMSGNVSEWCQDNFDEYASKSSTNPVNETKGSAKVIRGSSFGNGAYNCTVSFRDYAKPESVSEKIGFRVVCSANE